MRIRFLLLNAYTVGGTVRTVTNQANALAAAGHEVEIVSVNRRRTSPAFPLHPDIQLRALVDATASPPRWAKRRWQARRSELPSALVPRAEVKYDRFSRLTDSRIVSYLRSLDGGFLITTRPALNLLAARFAPASVVTIGQEHLHHGHHRPDLAEQIDLHYRRLDALTTLTEADRAIYADRLGGAGVRVERIPNPLSGNAPAPSPLDRPLIVSAGRLVKAKGFHTLIEAFAPIAAAHPEWRLRIHGSGPDRDRLRALIHERHLYNHVFLMGSAPLLDTELAKASVFALASRHEGFGMVLAEAMSHGVPPVSFDCPYGPREIITDGEDGLLVPLGDTAALTTALTRLVEEPATRHVLGTKARIAARRYEAEPIRRQWEDFLAELQSARSYRRR